MGPRTDAFLSGAMLSMSYPLMITGAPWWLWGGAMCMGIIHLLCSIFVPEQEANK